MHPLPTARTRRAALRGRFCRCGTSRLDVRTSVRARHRDSSRPSLLAITDATKAEPQRPAGGEDAACSRQSASGLEAERDRVAAPAGPFGVTRRVVDLHEVDGGELLERRIDLVGDASRAATRAPAREPESRNEIGDRESREARRAGWLEPQPDAYSAAVGPAKSLSVTPTAGEPGSTGRRTAVTYGWLPVENRARFSKYTFLSMVLNGVSISITTRLGLVSAKTWQVVRFARPIP